MKGKGLGVGDHGGMCIPPPFIHKTLGFNLQNKTIAPWSPPRKEGMAKGRGSASLRSIISHILLHTKNEELGSAGVAMTKLSAEIHITAKKNLYELTNFEKVLLQS